MSRNKEITDKLAIQILDNDIEKCKNALLGLEVGAEDFDNVYMEMRSYQMHKEILLKDGGLM